MKRFRPIGYLMPENAEVAILGEFEHFGITLAVLQFRELDNDSLPVINKEFVKESDKEVLQSSPWTPWPFLPLEIGHKYSDRHGVVYEVVYKTETLDGEIVFVGYCSKYDLYVATLGVDINGEIDIHG